MRVELAITSGSRAGQHELLEMPLIRIGRHPANDVRFHPELDTDVSGMHCEIKVIGARLVIHDSNSTNGTFVNGQRVGRCELFRGDLRGLLKALEDGITGLLGLTSGGAEVAPVGLNDLLLSLRQRNQAELQDQLGDTAWGRLLAWAQVDPASMQTQTQLVTLWQGKQPSGSQTLQQLIEAGAVEALPRRGREAIQYLMTGTARLAL